MVAARSSTTIPTLSIRLSAICPIYTVALILTTDRGVILGRAPAVRALTMYDTVRVGARAPKSTSVLCQNCVRYPPKPCGNTIIYREASTRIDVVEVVDPKVRWWGLVCVSTRERNQFPSVLLQPLGNAQLGEERNGSVEHCTARSPADQRPG